MRSNYKYTIIDHSLDGVIRNGQGYIEDLVKLIPIEIIVLIKLEDSHKGGGDIKLDAVNMAYEIKEI